MDASCEVSGGRETGGVKQDKTHLVVKSTEKKEAGGSALSWGICGQLNEKRKEERNLQGESCITD